MEEKNTNSEQVNAQVEPRGLAKISYYILYILVLILPFFTIPNFPNATSVSKSALTLGAVFLLLTIWIIGKLSKADIKILKNPVSYFSGLVVFAYLISSIFSKHPDMSFFGFGYENGTFFFVLSMFILMFLIPTIVNTKKKYLGIANAFIMGSLILFFIQFINLLKPLNFLGLSTNTSSLLGTWNSLGLMFGLTSFLALTLISNTSSGGKQKFYLTAFVLMLIGQTIVNFEISWWLTLSLTLVYLIYTIAGGNKDPQTSFDQAQDQSDKKKNRKNMLVAILLLISVAFLIFGREGDIGTQGGFLNRLTDKITLSPLEVRPSFKGTVTTIKGVYEESVLFGVGPNMFKEAWKDHKPESIIQNPYFWNTEFDYGSSYLTTQFTNTGIVGFVSLILFLISILYYIARGISLSHMDQDLERRRMTVFLGLGSLFGWSSMALYTTSTTLVVFTFLFTGLYLSVLKDNGLFTEKNISLSRTNVYNFASVIVLVIIFILTVSTAFIYTKKVRAWSGFNQSLVLVSQSEFNEASSLLRKSINLDSKDLYYRISGEVGILRLDEIANRQGAVVEELRPEFEKVSVDTNSDLVTAVELRDDYYQNYLSLAQFYMAVIKYGAPPAYDVVLNTYDQAISVAGDNPIPIYEKAKLQIALGNTESGINLLNQAIEVKPNYTDALYLRSQLAINSGNLESAIEDTINTLRITPINSGLLFQAGYLKYRAKSYEDAIVYLERAIYVNPSYANARYFLGLALNKVGKREEAINQFKTILELNPGHSGVMSIIRNLERGRDPFEGLAPSELPESSSNPPIDETE